MQTKTGNYPLLAADKDWELSTFGSRQRLGTIHFWQQTKTGNYPLLAAWIQAQCEKDDQCCDDVIGYPGSLSSETADNNSERQGTVAMKTVSDNAIKLVFPNNEAKNRGIGALEQTEDYDNYELSYERKLRSKATVHTNIGPINKNGLITDPSGISEALNEQCVSAFSEPRQNHTRHTNTQQNTRGNEINDI
ncbi:hypothetical protein Pmani_007088 [Petrolisthes manimaculis]|uniref:Uncharacterized protein n=1 Tax=Petrolisthes manimaculis TaxID=1843537 RepID=A0AAE1Q9N1_9EUCA|nr:hypothetical protein Pmani_007088 [Petrolisthes manimaculis]